MLLFKGEVAPPTLASGHPKWLVASAAVSGPQQYRVSVWMFQAPKSDCKPNYVGGGATER